MPDGTQAQPNQTISDRYAAGYRFGQYEIIDHIGSGGMAEVYEAKHVALEKRVALKVLTTQCAEKEALRHRFLREGKRAASIRHDHVVDITDVGEVDGLPYLVMEYLHGETLGQRLDRDTRMPVQEAVHLILPVIAAAWAGHQKGVVHRDLKPENILLAREGAQRVRPKVLDFGVSRGVGDEDQKLTLPNAVLGTPIYMSPEQARGDHTDERSDQYSLAVVLYESVTGEVPRPTHDSLLKALSSAAKGEVIPPSQHLPEIDPELEKVLLTALSSDPANRYADLPTFAGALLAWASPRAQEYWGHEFGAGSTTADSLGPPSVSGEHLVTQDSGPPLPSDHAPVSSGAKVRVQVSSSGSPPNSGDPSSGEPSSGDPAKTIPLMDAPGANVTQASTEADDASTSRRSTVGDTTLASEEGRSAWPAVVAALALVGLAGFWWFGMRAEKPPPAAPTAASTPVTYPIHLEVTPADATIELDGKPVGQGSYSAVLPKDGAKHVVVYRADGHGPREVTFQDVGPPAGTVKLEPLAESTPSSSSTTPPAPPSPTPATPPSKARDKASTKTSDKTPTSPPPAPPAKPAPTDDWASKKGSDNKDPWKD